MGYPHELIVTEKDLPVKIIYHESDERDYVPRHWHDSIEISYVLSGQIDNIYVEGKHYTSRKGDIVLINSNCVHSVSVDTGKGRRALTLLIPSVFIRENAIQSETISFDCISISEKDEKRCSRFDELRKTMDSMLAVHLRYNKDPYAYLKLKSLSFELLYLLLTHFKTDGRRTETFKTTKHLERLTLITNYIQERYNQRISLSLISREFGLSSEYLSRFFQNHVGMTVLDYLNAIRLERAYRDLMNTDFSVTHIAYEHGFPNEKSLNRVFREVYKVTPHEYRKKHAGISDSGSPYGPSIF